MSDVRRLEQIRTELDELVYRRQKGVWSQQDSALYRELCAEEGILLAHPRERTAAQVRVARGPSTVTS